MKSLHRQTAAILCVLTASVQAESTTVESPAVPANVLTESRRDSAVSTAPQTIQIIPGINEIIPVAVGHLNRIVTPFDRPHVRTVSQATTPMPLN